MDKKQEITYSATSYHWQTTREIASRIKSNHGVDYDISLIVVLRSLEYSGLLESKWLTDEPTEYDIENRGGARRRVYRRVAGSHLNDGEMDSSLGDLTLQPT